MSSVQIKEGSTNNLAGDQLTKNSISPASPQLATMTNVNVLDLHKDYVDATKVYDKETNTVYVYSHNPKHVSPNTTQDVTSVIDSAPPMTSMMLSPHTGIIQRQTSNNSNSHENHVSHIIDGRLVASADNPTTLLTRPTDVPITRIVDDQFIQRLVENHEVVSRDFVNGEHHIITRNENGEHILTRIVQNTEHKIMTNNDSAYDMPPPNLPLLNDKHHTILSSFTAESNLKQSLYSNNDKNDVMYAKSEDAYGSLNPEDNTKNHVEMIYTEDGNKTVIYTTGGSGSDQKTVELYQTGTELGVIGENQVILQGGIQYTAQTGPNGTTVYVLSGMHDSENANGNSRYANILKG